MLGAVWGPGDALVNEIGWVSVFTCEDCFRCGSLWGSTVTKGDGLRAVGTSGGWWRGTGLFICCHCLPQNAC